jgi:hypothetical protein
VSATARDLFEPGADTLFAGLFATMFGIGTYPEPPDVTVLRILGLESRPATQDEVKSASRARLRQVHPDVVTYEGTHLAEASAAVAVQRAEVRELMWARDVLLRKIPPAVTGDKGSVSDSFSRNAACAACGRTITGLFGKPPLPATTMRRWRGYCAPCAEDAELARIRELRRLARADRKCPGCSRTFTPPRSDGRYCSPACRQRAYRQRQRDTAGAAG